jgi:L-histidine N-alpha-methyltransferase
MKYDTNHMLQAACKGAVRSTPSENVDSAFLQEVQEGLSADPKYLSSKYFYDKTGDKLFQAIMDMPEYYLTRTEYKILDQHKKELLALFSNKSNSFHLVEFGAGDGLKTKVLLKHFAEQNALFHYIPIDISGHVLQLLAKDLQQQLPTVKVTSLQGEYFQGLKRLCILTA